MTTIDASNSNATTAPEANPNKELREYAERVAEENKQLRARVLEGDIRKLGLEPDKELGLAVSEGYDGDLDFASLSTWVKDKYKYEAPVDEVAVAAQAEQTAQELQAAEAVAQQLQGVSDSVQPAGIDTQAATVEGKMHDPEAGEAEAMASMSSKLNRLLNQ